MIFDNNKLKLMCNDFTRDYDIYDKKTKKLIACSESDISLQDEKIYLEYVNSIDSVRNVYYNITKICNLRCTYCYSKNNREYISLEDNEIVLDKLENLRVKEITLIGGEPFCHPNFKELLTNIKKRTSFREICIVTNGTLIGKYIELLRDERITLQISLDGIDEESNSITRGKGNFNKVIDNINILKENDIKFKVMKVITFDNIDSSKEYYDYYKNKGISSGFFMVKQVEKGLKPTISQIEDLLEYIYISENKNIYKVFDIVKFADNMMFDSTGFPIMHCGAGINALSINPNGDVFPCVKRTEKSDFIVNIYDTDAVNAIKKNKKNIIEKEFVNNKKNCSKCEIKYFCGGGCRAEELDNESCRYNCEYFKLAVEFFFKKILESY